MDEALERVIQLVVEHRNADSSQASGLASENPALAAINRVERILQLAIPRAQPYHPHNEAEFAPQNTGSFQASRESTMPLPWFPSTLPTDQNNTTAISQSEATPSQPSPIQDFRSVHYFRQENQEISDENDRLRNEVQKMIQQREEVLEEKEEIMRKANEKIHDAQVIVDQYNQGFLAAQRANTSAQSIEQGNLTVIQMPTANKTQAVKHHKPIDHRPEHVHNEANSVTVPKKRKHKPLFDLAKYTAQEISRQTHVNSQSNDDHSEANNITVSSNRNHTPPFDVNNPTHGGRYRKLRKVNTSDVMEVTGGGKPDDGFAPVSSVEPPSPATRRRSARAPQHQAGQYAKLPSGLNNLSEFTDSTSVSSLRG